MSEFSPRAYEQLLEAFVEGGYRYSSFKDPGSSHELLLRHDVDFSLSDAAALAELEGGTGAFATYFILLTSDFYNPWSANSRAQLRRLRNCGAVLALHFDPTAYEDLDAGFAIEKSSFEDLVEEPLSIVSFHRPRDFLKDNNRPLEGVPHTYEDRFFKDMAYFSDSGGSFRYGHPLDSQAFQERKTIHLNLHPIWWMRAGDNPSSKLRDFQLIRHNYLLGEISRNCLTFDGESALIPA